MSRIGPTAAARALSGVLLVTGTTHLTAPGFYDGLIPPALPGPARWWIYGSGLAELGCAAALAMPGSRRMGARASALLLVAVFPGNAWMAWERRDHGLADQLIAYGRLPLQLPLIWWARYAGRG